jgi:VanZ family protein
MKPAWIPRAQFAAFALFLLGVSSIPSHDLPSTEILGLDKAAHLVLYGGFGALAARAGFCGLGGVCAGAAWGGLDETYQRLIPGRTPDWADWAADICGVAAGMWAWSQYLHRQR